MKRKTARLAGALLMLGSTVGCASSWERTDGRGPNAAQAAADAQTDQMLDAELRKIAPAMAAYAAAHGGSYSGATVPGLAGYGYTPSPGVNVLIDASPKTYGVKVSALSDPRKARTAKK